MTVLILKTGCLNLTIEQTYACLVLSFNYL